MLDAFGVPQSIVVLGATSDIGEAILTRVIERGTRTVVLAGRDSGGLRSVRERVRAAGATDVHEVVFDALDVDDAAGAVDRCFESAGGKVDMVLLAVGVLGDQERDENDAGRVADVATVDFTWPAAALAAVADRMRAQGSGRLVILSSVAGVRVRRANYVYGAAKAGLDSYAIGLSEALRGSGVRVHVVRPGFVRSKMTAGRPDAPLPTTPDQVAADVIRGIELGQTVIWSPSILRWVFGIFRLLPQFVWRRLPG